MTALRIGDLARETATKVVTIRYYEKIGLLPEPPRTEGGQRRYGEEALKRLSFIRHARDLAFEVEDIRQLLALTGTPQRSCHEADSIALRHLGEIEARIRQLQSLRDAIGNVQQDVFLFSATIRENISYGRPGATQEEIEEAAKAARIHDFIMSQPDGYDMWVGERGSTLSGGQRQRVAIARTLLLNPRILIFDDSTAAVDMRTEFLIQEALRNLMEGRTTFVIAQRLRTVKEADLILVMQDGEIVERGKHEELLEHGQFYKRIYDLELRDQEEAAAAVTADEGGA